MAKLSAICLSNLSIESGLENILTKDSCCFAIVILIGLEKGKLLPICLQTLYNLTCVDKFYNGMEKISKVIISLPHLHNFDPTLTILKTLANYVRFESLRYKIVEEGNNFSNLSFFFFFFFTIKYFIFFSSRLFKSLSNDC